MKSLFRLCVFVAMSAMTSTVSAFDPFVVKDIRLDGVQRTDPGAIFSNLSVKVGDVFSPGQSSSVIKNLFKTGFFKDIKIGIDGDALVITVVERPTIFQVDVVGAKIMTDEQLLGVLSDIGLKQSAVLNDSILDTAERELKNLYVSQGKYGVEIVSTVTPIERNRASISFEIFEGRKARIQSISFVGNHHFSTGALLGEMSLYSSGFLGLFSGSEEYSRQKLEGDLENIRSLYLDHGFVDFDIVSTQVRLAPDKESVYVVIVLAEGEAYRFGTISVAGDRVVSHDELSFFVDINPGDLFSQKRLSEVVERIENRLAEDGYAYASVNLVPQKDLDEETVSFSLYVSAGRRIYVRRIEITGNVDTRDEVVRRELRQLEGSWYSVKDIDRSKQRLDLLGFFTSVEVDTIPVEGESDQVDVEFRVVEGQTGSLSLGVGYSSTDRMVLTANVTQQNFMGAGNALGFQVSSGKVNETYAVTYTNPYITDDGVSRTTKLAKKDTDVTSLLVSSFQSSSLSASVEFGVPLTEYDRIFYGLGYEETELTISSSSPSVYREFVDQNGSKNTVFPLTVGWSRDRRDSAYYPTSGVAQRLNTEVSTPVGDLSYYSLTYKAEWYKPVTKNTSVHLEGALAYAEDFDGDNLPFYKNFYAGGASSVRGFATSSLGPRNEFGETLGGKRRVTGTTELLFPIPGLVKDRSMRLALFLDAGAIDNNFDDALSEVRFSTGVGFLWYSPLGPMKFNLSRPLNDKVGDRTEKFQFTLGTLF